MKSLKKELIKIVVVIIIINILGILGSIYLEHRFTMTYSQTFNITDSSENVEQSYNPEEAGESSAQMNIEESQNTKNENYSSVQTEEGFDAVRNITYTEFNVVRQRLMIPYFFYFGIVLCSIIYGFIKVSKVIKDIINSQKVIETSLEKLEENKDILKYKELSAINDTVNESILEIKKARRLEKELIDFTMHDIKTPLQVIKGYAEILSLEDLEYGDNIMEQVNVLNNLVEDRLENLQFKKEDISFLLEKLIKEYKLIHKNIKFEFTREEGVYWEVNISTFRRILTNLIDNSIKALNQNLTIEINLTSNFLLLRDYGPGISQKEYEKLIETSSGSGLKIVKKYLKINNLILNVFKRKDGTIFLISRNESEQESIINEL